MPALMNRAPLAEMTATLRAKVNETRRHAGAQGGTREDTLIWLLFVVGTAISRVGERLGAPWLIYNPVLFGFFHLVGVRVAPGLYRALADELPDARRLADVGAGSGAMAAHGRRLGLDVVACEHSPFGRMFARAQGVASVPFDVRTDSPGILGAAADVAYCIEVAEHLPPELGQKLVAFLCQTAPLVLFTAAHPGQGGQGHINEQSREYWVDQFTEQGMEYLPNRTRRMQQGLSEHLEYGRWIPENVMIFGRAAQASVPRAVVDG
jgi:SAM-dependent methyltransferase